MPEVAAITWVHDSTPTTIVRNGSKLNGHRVLVNNRSAAFLYTTTAPGPVARLDGVTLKQKDKGFEVTGTNADGEVEVWYHDAVPKRAGGCSSCGGGR